MTVSPLVATSAESVESPMATNLLQVVARDHCCHALTTLRRDNLMHCVSWAQNLPRIN